MHFVHRLNPENEGVLYDENGDGETIPLHSDPAKASRFDLWTIKDKEVGIAPDATALDVLLRILAGTIQLERVNTVWRACGDETKSSSRTSTRGGPNGAPAN